MSLSQPHPLPSRDDPLRAAQAEVVARLHAEGVPLRPGPAARMCTAGIAAAALLAMTSVAYEVAGARSGRIDAEHRAHVATELEHSCILTYNTPGLAQERGFRSNTESVHAGQVKLQDRGGEFVLVVPIAAKASLSGRGELAIPLSRDDAVGYAESIAQCFSLKAAKLGPAVPLAVARGPRP